MPRCEDYPCCGHGPASTGGDGGGCPDEDGRYKCVLCQATLEKGARSSICARCLKSPRQMSGEFDDSPDMEDY
jgi:hypothetical protein